MTCERCATTTHSLGIFQLAESSSFCLCLACVREWDRYITGTAAWHTLLLRKVQRLNKLHHVYIVDEEEMKNDFAVVLSAQRAVDALAQAFVERGADGRRGAD